MKKQQANRAGNKQMMVIQVGNGKIARLHRDNFPEGIKVGCIIVRDVEKHKRLARDDPTLGEGVFVTSTVAGAISAVGNPFFWDVASDDDTHAFYVDEISRRDPHANISLSKSPYSPANIAELRSMMNSQKIKLALTENYVYSNVAAKAAELVKKEGFDRFRICFDFTKNRARDIEKGRFLHECGVACYEGSHIFTVLHILGEDVSKILSYETTPLHLSDGTILEDNGSAYIEAVSGSGKKISIYESMDGRIRHNIPELKFKEVIGYGDESRYRVLIIEDEASDRRIVAQFEPLHDKPRFVGRVLLLDGTGVVDAFEDIPENTLKAVFTHQVGFFLGKEGNPFDVSLLQSFSLLHEAHAAYKQNHSNTK